MKAQGGVVTLTGKVQDREQRKVAESTVASLPGVVNVQDEIEVATDAPEHSDKWMAMEIRSLLLVKAHVSAADTTCRREQRRGHARRHGGPHAWPRRT